MTVKLNSLARWATLAATDAIVFEGFEDTERRVRLNLNLEGVTAFFIGDTEGESFLCTVGPGLETVEFNRAGRFKVYAENGSGVVQFQSAELEEAHIEVVDPVIFTKIAQRRHRNPELEEMMYRMQVNMERRFAAQADEIEAQYQRQLQEAKNAAVKTDDTPVAAGAGASEVPAQGAGSEKPGENAAAPAGSEQQGGNGGTSTGTV